jgi:hypothetical protein
VSVADPGALCLDIRPMPIAVLALYGSDKMLASRGMKPKLSLTVSTNAAQSARPSLVLKSPVSMSIRSPVSPSPISPTARNTKLNQRGFSTMQHPTYAYQNTSSSRSILKKGESATAAAHRRLQFCDKPIVHKVEAIEEEDYYGTYTKMTRDERRWQK